jgi:hypothetical protein
MMRMPFDKHEDAPFDQLPDNYVSWLPSLPSVKDTLRSALRSELKGRESDATLTPTRLPLVDGDDGSACPTCRGDMTLDAWVAARYYDGDTDEQSTWRCPQCRFVAVVVTSAVLSPRRVPEEIVR